MSGVSVSLFRAWMVYLSVLVAFGILLTRLFYLHVIDHERLLAMAEQNRRDFRSIPAQRGSILDNRGNLLAATRTFITVGLDPHALREGDEVRWNELADLIGVELGTIASATERRFRTLADGTQRKNRWVPLADGLDEDTYDLVRALGIRGVRGDRNYLRSYPGGSLAAHVLGFVNREGDPVTGVERVLDFYLRGQSGWREIERDGRRHEMAQFRSREIQPTSGLNVQLTLDQTVQDIVEEEIERIVAEYSPKGVNIIVSEPGSGAILALANYPTFDPNRFWEYEIDSHRNRAISDIFEPGSTFKIVSTAAVLNEALVQEDDVFPTGKQRVEYRGRMVRLPSDHRNFESLTAREILVRSSNRGVAHFGMLLGERRLYEYTRAFGFGERSGLELGGELRGILHPVNRWDGLTITRLPMGHAVGATPMQVHQASSVLANRGVLVAPRLFERVFDQSGEEIMRFESEPIRRVISTETAFQVSDMLAESVGVSGTARAAEIPGFQVAGKTGTTQKLIDGRYSNRHHVASFSGFFPADRPDLVITVIVDEPTIPGTGYGGRVAAPAFRNIGTQLIPYRGIRPSESRDSMIAAETHAHP